MWQQWIHFALTSSGVMDAFRPVLLGADGKLHYSFLPAALLWHSGGSGGLIVTESGEALSFGDV